MQIKSKMKAKTVKNSYSFYKKTIENPVDIKTYIYLANKYNKFLVNKVIEGEQITLPSRMGRLYILGKKQNLRFDKEGNVKGLAPDWVKTKKLWDSNPKAKEKKQLLYHTNEHSSNIRYKFLWSKERVLVTNKSLYALRMTRENKRKIHKEIMKGKEYVTKHYKSNNN